MDEKEIIYSSELIQDDAPGILGELAPQTHRHPEALAIVQRLSHYDESGQAHMVDVSGKPETRREAVAGAFVELSETVLKALPHNPKGNPLEVARFAGIMAAKKTSDLIPMCHPLALSFVDVQATVVEGGVAIEATAATVAGTGVEMEAMVAASVAALTVYDMTKALDKGIRIREVVLLRKSGGKSGEYRRGQD
jgi:cyclic pyranopterin monophosphate synthase